jgi:hypothetical protein
MWRWLLSVGDGKACVRACVPACTRTAWEVTHLFNHAFCRRAQNVNDHAFVAHRQRLGQRWPVRHAWLPCIGTAVKQQLHARCVPAVGGCVDGVIGNGRMATESRTTPRFCLASVYCVRVPTVATW